MSAMVGCTKLKFLKSLSRLSVLMVPCARSSSVAFVTFIFDVYVFYENVRQVMIELMLAITFWTLALTDDDGGNDAVCSSGVGGGSGGGKGSHVRGCPNDINSPACWNS